MFTPRQTVRGDTDFSVLEQPNDEKIPDQRSIPISKFNMIFRSRAFVYKCVMRIVPAQWLRAISCGTLNHPARWLRHC